MTTDNLFRYFSQNGEDFLLWEFFDHKEDGFFVDVGAFDGVHLSNSYFFEQVGWKGICVEPHARFFALCEKNRPGTACINCLAGSKDGVEIPFYQEKLGLLSTTVVDADVEADVTKRYESRGLVFEGFSEVVLKTQTLNTMLHNHLEPGEKIDFISIDVEGAELEVLRGLSLEEFAPRVLVIEANSAAHVKELTEYLEPFGYFLARKHEVNFYFVSSQEDAHKLQEIIVDCQIEKQSHPDGLELTLPEFITGKNIIQNLPKQKYINKTQDSIAEHMA
jgi:FkbM family methyltransferase